MRKYIGIDYGDVRIGVSTCDSLGILASGLCVIDKTKTDYIKEIVDICNQENTFKIVLGKPIRMNGNSEIQVEKVEKFAQELKNAEPRITIDYIDERLTTKQAENILRTTKKNAKQKRQIVDMVAATIILQVFLDKKINLTP